MKFATSYEPGEYEPDIYAAWEAADEFLPGGKVGGTTSFLMKTQIMTQKLTRL